MLCSAKELGIDADASGLMELPADAPVGESLATYLGLPDASIELKLTPNRPDCLSVHGLARDVGGAVRLGVPCAGDRTAAGAIEQHARAIRLDAGADCPRYLGRVIEGIDRGREDAALARRALASFGPASDQRGRRRDQLRHDRARPAAARVRQRQSLPATSSCAARAHGETLKLLDGSEHRAHRKIPRHRRRAEGASRSAASWAATIRASPKRRATCSSRARTSHRRSIMGRSRELGLHSDAAHRFERGVDPELPQQRDRARDRTSDRDRGRQSRSGRRSGAHRRICRVAMPVTLRRARLARVLDLAVADAEVERILAALGMRVERTADGWRATPPSWRFDIAIEEDLIEEVVRVHGYERVPTRAPRGELRVPAMPEAQLGADRVPQPARGARLCRGDLLRVPRCGDAAALEARRRRRRVRQSAVGRARRHAHVAAAGPRLGAGRRTAAVSRSACACSRSATCSRLGKDAPVENARIAGVAVGTRLRRAMGRNAAAPGRFLRRQRRCRIAARADAMRRTNSAGRPPDAPWLHPGQSADLFRGNRRIGTDRRAASGSRAGRSIPAPTSTCSSSISRRFRAAAAADRRAAFALPVGAPRSLVRAARRGALRPGRSGDS